MCFLETTTTIGNQIQQRYRIVDRQNKNYQHPYNENRWFKHNECFKPPQDVDDDNNKIRMSSLLTDRCISQNKNRNNNDETNYKNSKESETKGVVSPKDAMVDLNSRTHDSLDYEIMLSTLQKQCYAKPACDCMQHEMNSCTPLTSKKKLKKNRLSAQTHNHVLKNVKDWKK